jgi:UDP-4-amino-4,6-dideoxy-N-acetyl-beta-L-altrosamine transaminase
MIPYGRQNISEEDIAKVVEVLKSDYLTQGHKLDDFEHEVAFYLSVNHAVAVNSGTSALHLACLALGLGKGDLLWTSPITFVASANCALYCGAEIDFVEIAPDSWNISVNSLSKKLKQAKKVNRLPKVVVAVHLCGLSCEMKSIYALSVEYGFHVIEDAAHALGGKYGGEPIGNCKYSDIAVFSFHPVKIITTGEGGMAVTNSIKLANKMKLLRSHGITRDPEQMDQVPDGPWFYQQIDLGYNYRMTDFQAALGTSQMKRLDSFVLKRHELANQYSKQLKGLPLQLPVFYNDEHYSSLHLYVIRLVGVSKIEHKRIFMALRDNGIGVNLHYIPVHLQPYYAGLGFKKGNYPRAERYYKEAITLPMYPELSNSDVSFVVSSLKKILHN